MLFARTNSRRWSVPVLLKNTTRPCDERDQRSRASIGMSPAKHGIACPHDGGTKSPASVRGFSRKADIASGSTSVHRTSRCARRYARPNCPSASGCEHLRKTISGKMPPYAIDRAIRFTPVDAGAPRYRSYVCRRMLMVATFADGPHAKLRRKIPSAKRPGRTAKATELSPQPPSAHATDGARSPHTTAWQKRDLLGEA